MRLALALLVLGFAVGFLASPRKSAAQGPAATIAAKRIQLTQSIPAETDLAQPDLPFTRDVWLEMIRGAKKSIDLAQFYMSSSPGSALDDVIGELAKAGARGVRIRALVSNALLKDSTETMEQVRKIPGAELRLFDISKLTGGILHAKYWIVDGREIFIGSNNFDWRSLTHIHETGARIQDGRLAAKLGKIFAIDWNYAKTGKMPAMHSLTESLGKPARGTVELVASPTEFNPPGVKSALTTLLDLLASAKQSIRVQLLDYKPLEERGAYWPDIDNALRAAAARGVRVDLLVSNWNVKKPAINYLKSLAVIPNIDVRIATIPQSSKGFIPYARVIHSKYLLVDDGVLWLGTSNWSQDYFIRSRNVELLFHSPELNRKVSEIFEKLWGSRYVEKVDLLREYIPPQIGPAAPEAKVQPEASGKP